MNRPSSISHWLFLVLALSFGAAAAAHACALVVPSLMEPSPAWRHALFVVINGAVATLLVRRPPWFAVLFAALCLQQLYSHATSGWDVWARQHRLDWASLLVVIALPPIAALLLAEGWSRMGGAKGRKTR
jgi:hypothetical protein